MALTIDEQIAVQKQGRLNEIETQYLRAKEYVKSDTFVKDQSAALGRIRKVIGTKGMTGDEALYAMGRVQQILLTLYEHEGVITETEDIKKSLAERFPPK